MTGEDIRDAYVRTTKAKVTHPFADVAATKRFESAVRYVYENSLALKKQ